MKVEELGDLRNACKNTHKRWSLKSAGNILGGSSHVVRLIKYNTPVKDRVTDIKNL
jgi:hypothetical protein